MAQESSSSTMHRLVGWMGMTLIPERFAPRRLFGRGIGGGVIAIGDQALVSGVNFATGLILARYLSQESFGYYALLFAVLLFINGLHSSLITAPMMVFLPRYEAQQRGGYLNSLWVVQLIGCVLTAAVIGALWPSIRRSWPGMSESVWLIPLILVVTTYLSQEFVRRLLFAQRQSINGLKVDIISYGIQLLAIIVLIAQGRLTLGLVIWAMGLTSLASCLVGCIWLRLTLSAVSKNTIAATWRKHWEHGRWLASGTLAQWSSSQIYLFVVASLLSVTASALLAASRNLMGFTHIFMLGLENFVPAMVTRRLLQGGVDAMGQWLKRFRLTLALVMGTYCALIAVFAGPLMQGVFGPQYAEGARVVMLLAVFYFVSIFVRAPMIGLRAMEQPRWIFFAYLTSAAVTLTISVPLVTWAGVEGAASGMIITQVILLVVANIGYRRAVKATRALRSGTEALAVSAPLS